MEGLRVWVRWSDPLAIDATEPAGTVQGSIPTNVSPAAKYGSPRAADGRLEFRTNPKDEVMTAGNRGFGPMAAPKRGDFVLSAAKAKFNRHFRSLPHPVSDYFRALAYDLLKTASRTACDYGRTGSARLSA